MQDLPLFKAVWYVYVHHHTNKSLGENVFVILIGMIFIGFKYAPYQSKTRIWVNKKGHK